MITVVGTGTGVPLPPDAGAALAGAGLVVGGRRHLAAATTIPDTAERVVLGPLAPALDAIEQFLEKPAERGRVVVLASGDPGFFGIVRALAERFGAERLDVHPGVSSVATAFARLGLTWDDAVVVSAHGRDLRTAVNVCRAHPKVAVLTGPGSGPAELGAALRSSGRVLVVASALGAGADSGADSGTGASTSSGSEVASDSGMGSGSVAASASASASNAGATSGTGSTPGSGTGSASTSNAGSPSGIGSGAGTRSGTGTAPNSGSVTHSGERERVERVTPAEAAARDWGPAVSVVLCLDEARVLSPVRTVAGPPSGPAQWALEEGEFTHRDSMITKFEVRALALARLGPGLGEHVWDIGAGSGSVAVECARLGAAVTAVEKTLDGVERVRANAAAHGVYVTAVHGAAPTVLSDLPDPDAVFIGGGGRELPAIVTACARRARRSVVVAMAALDRVPAVRDALVAAGLDCDGVLLQSSRLAPLPGDVTRLAATNPVFLLWGVRPPARDEGVAQ
ncbi:precorrin-6y C5,15-methyltransferase (decarboxylating) subunit CbiE [Streptomyces phaeochromogenes]|uniref:Precorrin-6y C5,15-methyltransferase (Decarboxylating) subunit CbiE n=1 Tax=Streptomyces phaeochromogenes TaxID=1923 RepID=A0ABZ1HNF7_STRPH|nr:precorrin-6y C5,15-methyltransferase (decarboxylating) subunit CbiE [Streptomyces phaeochromogenes]WSD18730.1 precorrin-6y C5,15-methyltransferase (decarboxylating) subunit CbiE [Streptomyces phaeochromogenes]